MGSRWRGNDKVVEQAVARMTLAPRLRWVPAGTEFPLALGSRWRGNDKVVEQAAARMTLASCWHWVPAGAGFPLARERQGSGQVRKRTPAPAITRVDCHDRIEYNQASLQIIARVSYPAQDA